MQKMAYKINDEYYFVITPKISSPFIISETEYDELTKIKHEVKQFSPMEAIKEFPQAKKFYTAQIKILNKEISDLTDYKRQAMSKEYIEELIQEKILLRDQLKRAVNFEHMTEMKGLPIDEAKLIPITQFIQFNNSGFAKCIFHNEKTGSMKYYPKDNHCYCFSCAKKADVIDIVQQLNSCTIQQAVNFILNK